MPFTALRVLLVEDDDTDALLFDRVVADGSVPLRIRRTASLAEAVAAGRAARDTLDVVLLDLGLPDSQGLSTFTRFCDAVDGVPVVVLTGMQDDEAARAAIEAGAQDYIVKNDLAHLPVGRVLAHAVERHRLKQRLLADAHTLAEQQAKLRAIFDRSLDAFLLVDDGGRVLDVNPATEDLTRRTAAEIQARPLEELVRGFDGGPLGLADLRSRGDAKVTARVPRGAGPAEVELLLTLDVAPGQHLVSMRDVTDRNSSQRELVAKEARFRDLVELADDVLYRLRVVPEEVVEYASPALAMVTGVPVSDFYASSELWSSQVHPGDLERWTDRSRLEQGHSDRLVVRWRLPDGSWAWLEDRRTPLLEDGRLVAIQGILRDVTARERTEEALREALRQEREAVEKLQSLDRMKGTFLQALSHELRTPLTVIRGFALTLDQHGTRMSEAQRAVLVERLTAASERLERLLVDLLDVDRLTRGVVPVDRRPTNVGVLIDGVLAEVDAHQHDVAVECDRGLLVPLDAPKTERIVENLVRNAIKHTPVGTRVRVVVTGDEDGIVLTVDDDGPGVPPELVERIFEPFEQGAPSNTDASPGTGIGLALVAKFAELHGGRARVESATGGGATFVVELPARTREELPGQAPTGPSTSRGPRPDDAPGEAVVAQAVRQLLHAVAVDEIPGVLVAAVDRLGGRTTVDEADMPATLPLDLSLGLGRPLFAAAPPGSPARVALETHLPRLVEDAHRAAERCRQLAERRSRPPSDAAQRQDPRRPAEPVGLDDLGPGASVVLLRFDDDGTAPRPVHRAAQVLADGLRATDRVVVLGDDELVVLLPGAEDDGVEAVVDRVVTDLRHRQPALAVHVGMARVDERGAGAACRRAREVSHV